MKNLFKTSFALILFFSFSLLFTSCSNDKEYNSEITTADSLFTNQNYTKAKTHYLKAFELKKNETYPTEQITKIDDLKGKKVDFDYTNKIEAADAFFDNKEYNNAKRAYVDASTLKPGEAYPKAKINEIEKLTTIVEVTESKPYHVIAGSYAIEANADALHKKFSDKEGRKSTIEKS